MSRKAEQIVAALLEANDDKSWLMQQPNDLPARQIGGDFGDPWTHGGSWESPGDLHTLIHIDGLEGEGIKDVESWDIKVPPAIEAELVERVLPGTPYRTVAEVGEVMDPDDPGRYLYREEEREIDQLLDEWKTAQAEAENQKVTMPVYVFTDEVEDWMRLDELRAQLDAETWNNMSNADKVIEYGGHSGFHELDSYPSRYSKEEFKKWLNLEDL